MTLRYLFYILVAVVLLIGCNKDYCHVSQEKDEDVWISQIELAVPINLSCAPLTKAAPYESLSQLTNNIGVFAIDKTKDVDEGIYMNNVKATISDDKIKFVPEPVYYPYTSNEKLSFYGYYARVSTGGVKVGSQSVDVPVELGDTDILWATAKAENFNVAGQWYDGYNARYIRALYLYDRTEYLPKFRFEHVTACLDFKIKKEENSTNRYTQRIRVTGLSLNNMCTKAFLRVADQRAYAEGGGFDESGYKVDEQGKRLEGVLIPDETSVGTLPMELMLGDYRKELPTFYTDLGCMYICPVEGLSTVSGQIQIELYSMKEGTVVSTSSCNVPFTLDLSAEVGEFKAGYKYILKLNLKESVEVSIGTVATIKPYMDAWGIDDAPEWDPDAI